MKKLYKVEPKNPLAVLSVCLMGLSFTLRLMWALTTGKATESWADTVVHLVLPLSACVLFAVFLIAEGRTNLRLTFIPVLLGVVFFILKAASFTPLHQILCTILYLAVAVLYGAAVLGFAPIRKLLIPLFGLPLLWHLVEDFVFSLDTYTPSDWLREGSVLCIMAALLCVSLAMREVKPD